MTRMEDKVEKDADVVLSIHAVCVKRKELVSGKSFDIFFSFQTKIPTGTRVVEIRF